VGAANQKVFLSELENSIFKRRGKKYFVLPFSFSFNVNITESIAFAKIPWCAVLWVNGLQGSVNDF
jgi:hypothetical protein